MLFPKFLLIICSLLSFILFLPSLRVSLVLFILFMMPVHRLVFWIPNHLNISSLGAFGFKKGYQYLFLEHNYYLVSTNVMLWVYSFSPSIICLWLPRREIWSLGLHYLSFARLAESLYSNFHLFFYLVVSLLFVYSSG